MGNLIVKAAIPTPTPQATRQMDKHEVQRHRAKIAFEVEVVMEGYWKNDLAPELKAAVMADWSDELEDWTIDQVRWGLRQWRRENPRYKPNPGNVLAILKEQRGKTEMAKLAALPRPEPERRKPVTPERASRILAEVGFRPRRIEGATE